MVEAAWPHLWPSTASDYVDIVRWVALESTDFRYKSTENHPKVLILQGFYGSGTGGREFESRHFDQQKREMHRISLFCWFKLMDERSLQAASNLPPLTSSVRLVAELARRSSSELCSAVPPLRPSLTNSNVRNSKRIVNGLVRFFFIGVDLLELNLTNLNTLGNRQVSDYFVLIALFCTHYGSDKSNTGFDKKRTERLSIEQVR